MGFLSKEDSILAKTQTQATLNFLIQYAIVDDAWNAAFPGYEFVDGSEVQRRQKQSIVEESYPFMSKADAASLMSDLVDDENYGAATARHQPSGAYTVVATRTLALTDWTDWELIAGAPEETTTTTTTTTSA